MGSEPPSGFRSSLSDMLVVGVLCDGGRGESNSLAGDLGVKRCGGTVIDTRKSSS
jgi:hypothetical protein